MRKNISFIPIFALLAGAVGFFLRGKELSTAIDPLTGLAERWSKFTIMLILLTVVAAVIFVLYGVVKMRGREVSPSYNTAFSAIGVIALFFAVIGGAAFVVGGALYYMDARLFRAGITDFVFALFAVISGVCQISMAFGAYKKRDKNTSHVAAVVTPLFLCLWLIIAYKDNATDPELLKYCGMCMALISAILSFYFSAGFAFNNGKAIGTVVFNLLAVYMCTVAMADFTALSLRLILVGVIVISGVNVSSLVGNSRKE